MIVSLFVSVYRRIRAMTRRKPHKIRLAKSNQISFIASGGKSVFKIIQ